jgi:predicted nucleic acid-binding protein
MLLDTSGLLCLFDYDEPFHELAHELFSASADWVTHSYVVAEFVSLAHARRLHRGDALRFIAALATNPQVLTVWVDRELNDKALYLLQARLDKSYSLCDAVSFVLMGRTGVTEALTTDHHFEQEGFVRLLK